MDDECYLQFAHVVKRLKICIFAVLVLMVGAGPSACLQCVAWAEMLHNFSREGSFADAVVKTFDGRHPCQLCTTIAREKQKEQKSPAALNKDFKIDKFLIAPAIAALPPTGKDFDYCGFRNIPCPEYCPAPPVPVPRQA